VHSILYVRVSRFVSPPDAESGWEDSERAVGREGRWSPMGEKVGFERVEGIHEQHALVVLAKNFSPELCCGSKVMTHRCEASTIHLGLVCECFHDSLGVAQYRDTIKVNAEWEETGKTGGLHLELILDSPFVCGKELSRYEIRKRTLYDELGRAWEIQQLIIESLRRLWPIVEERQAEQ
jgi:hypothetical protein